MFHGNCCLIITEGKMQHFGRMIVMPEVYLRPACLWYNIILREKHYFYMHNCRLTAIMHMSAFVRNMYCFVLLTM